MRNERYKILVAGTARYAGAATSAVKKLALSIGGKVKFAD